MTADAGSACISCGEPMQISDFGCDCCPECNHPRTADAGSALDVAGIAAVLAAHGAGAGATCQCGWAADRSIAFGYGTSVPAQYRTHVAEAVAAHVEALREADRAAPHPTADAGSALDVAGIFEAHPMWTMAGRGGDLARASWICHCGDWLGYCNESETSKGWLLWRAHLAAHVEALRKADRAAAWDEGYVAGNAFGYEWAQDTYDGPSEDPTENPYRSES